jgi:hypothetical protein
MSGLESVSHSELSPEDRPQPNARLLWAALQSISGGRALPTTWRQLLEADVSRFSAAFLRPVPEAPAAFVPCPFGCGCHHEVFKRENGTLGGECRCPQRRCSTYTVVPEEIIPLELDLLQTGRRLCQAFSLPSKVNKLGIYNFIQISYWSSDTIPIIFGVPFNEPECLNNIALLVKRFSHPFALLLPTDKFLNLAAKTLLETVGAHVICLDEHVSIAPNGQFSVLTPTKKLFEPLAGFLPNLSDEQRAGRICDVLDQYDARSRRRLPTLRSVYQLYCIEQMPVAQVAKKCRCATGTISNRLQFLQKLTGFSLDDLRNLSTTVRDFQTSLAAAKSENLTVKRRPH